MRTVTVADERKKVVIPYLIAGTGGIGSQPVPFNIGNMDPTQTVTYANALGSVGSEHTVYGYLRVHVSATISQATFVQTLSDHRNEFETVAIDLGSGQKTIPTSD
jgi:hypothetical protein